MTAVWSKWQDFSYLLYFDAWEQRAEGREAGREDGSPLSPLPAAHSARICLVDSISQGSPGAANPMAPCPSGGL